MYALWIALYLLVSFVSQSSCAPFVIGTGRGAIRAIQNGNSYTLRETTLNYWEVMLDLYNMGMTWNLTTDPRFPNGVFIESQLYPGLVWDTQGYKFTPGTNVVLSRKKNTLVDTKNQRWVHSAQNQFGIIYNTNMVANVTQGKVVLANKATSAFQKFYPLSYDSNDMWNITFENYMFSWVETLVQSPSLGNYTILLSNVVTPFALQFFPGTKLTFRIDPPYTYTLTGLPNERVVLPPRPIPLNTPTIWIGTMQGVAIEFLLTFSDDGMFSGSGYDAERGAFEAWGSRVASITMGVTYTNEGSFSFEGVLTNDANGIKISGSTERYDDECHCHYYGKLSITMQL